MNWNTEIDAGSETKAVNKFQLELVVDKAQPTMDPGFYS